MHIRADRIREAATVTGTGDFTLNGAVTNFEAFSDVMANGDTCDYAAVKEGGGWELGKGTMASGVLQRTEIYQSSNGDAAVSFSASSTVDIFLTVPGKEFIAPRASSEIKQAIHGGL